MYVSMYPDFNHCVNYFYLAGWHAEEFIGWEFEEPKTIREFSFMTTMKNTWKTHHPTIYIFQVSTRAYFKG
jgi:hypothetical protein